MGIIKQYRRPKSAGELAKALDLFLDDALGLEADEWENLDGYGGHTGVTTEDGDSILIVVQSEVKRVPHWQLVDSPEALLLLGWNKAGRPKMDFLEPDPEMVEEPSQSTGTPFGDLARAALAYWKATNEENFRDGPLGPIATGEDDDAMERQWNARSSAAAILHQLVLAAHGGGGQSAASGVMSLTVDGTTIVIDSEDGLEEGMRVHVLDPSDSMIVN